MPGKDRGLYWPGLGRSSVKFGFHEVKVWEYMFCAREIEGGWEWIIALGSVRIATGQGCDVEHVAAEALREMRKHAYARPFRREEPHA
jgi:hypothetical protein